MYQDPNKVARAVESAYHTEGAMSPGATSYAAKTFSGAQCAPNQALEQATVTGDAEALLKYLCSIRDSLSGISEKLFGPVPECESQCCPAPDSLHSRVVTASIMAGALANQAESIRKRI